MLVSGNKCYDLGKVIALLIYGQFTFTLLFGEDETSEVHLPAFIGDNHELYFDDDRIEERQAKLMEHQVRFVHVIKEQPWGQRVARTLHKKRASLAVVYLPNRTDPLA